MSEQRWEPTLSDEAIHRNAIRMHTLMELSYGCLPITLQALVANIQTNGRKVGYTFDSTQTAHEIAQMENDGLVGVVQGAYMIHPKGLFELRTVLINTRWICTEKLDGGEYGK